MAWTTILGRLAVAAGLSALIGIDRELRSKPAGLRTNIIIGVATAAFTLAGAELFTGGDPTRVASQIVSGIGFLGGGAIFAAGGKPHGLTTAAAMWGTAAVGMTAGLGEEAFAAIIVAVTVLVLWPLDWATTRFIERFARVDVRFEVAVAGPEAATVVQDRFTGRGLSVRSVDLRPLGDGLQASFTVTGGRRELDGLLRELGGHPDVRFVSHHDVAE